MPFFAETAQSIIDLYAAETTPTETALPLLVRSLQEQGANDKTVQAALAIWQSNVDLNTIREFGARCITEESLKEALDALILSAGDAPGSQIPKQTQAKLKAALRACFSTKATSTILQDAKDDLPAPFKIPAQQTAAWPAQATRVSATVAESGPQESAVASVAPPDLSRQPNGERQTTNGIDQDALDQLIAEGAGASAQTEDATDPLSLLEATLDSEAGKMQIDRKLTGETKKPASNPPAQTLVATTSTATAPTATAGLKIKDMAAVRPVGGSMPPTPDSTIPPKVTRRPASESGTRERRQDDGPIRRTSDDWPQTRADTYRPFEGDRPKLELLDIPLSDRISAREVS